MPLEPVMAPADWEYFGECVTPLPAPGDGSQPATVIENMIGALRMGVAMANAQLPDGDAYKLTWDQVDGLRQTGAALQTIGATLAGWGPGFYFAVADVLASYLPPRR